MCAHAAVVVDQQEPGDATEYFTIVMSHGQATEPGPATVGGDGGNDYTAHWAGLDYSNRPPPPPPPDTSNVGEDVAISLGVLVLIIGGGLTVAMCGGYCVFRKRQRKAGVSGLARYVLVTVVLAR
jgi:hypothetical protein